MTWRPSDNPPLPDPAAVAKGLPTHIREALIDAYQRDGTFAMPAAYAEQARRLALVGTGTNLLSAFGLKVRRAAIQRSQAQ